VELSGPIGGVLLDVTQARVAPTKQKDGYMIDESRGSVENREFRLMTPPPKGTKPWQSQSPDSKEMKVRE
jgi:hypothetical protein